MTTTQALCAVLRASLLRTGEKIPGKGEVDWRIVYEEACQQTVLGLADDLVQASREEIPQDVRECWHRQTMMHGVRNYQVLEQQKSLLALLSEHHIMSVILKGASIASYYPEPLQRAYGDVDLLVLPADFDHVFELLKKEGYELEPMEDFREHHIALEKNGISIELHKWAKTPEKWRSLIYEGVEHREYVQVEDYEVPSLPPLQMGLVLICHMISHLNFGFGLRQVIDWGMYVDKVVTDEFWEKALRPRLCEAGYEKICKTITKLCHNYFGFGAGRSWYMDGDDALCKELLDYLMEQGNFGKKREKMDVGAKILAHQKSPVEFLKHIQRRGGYNWRTKSGEPVVRRYPLLRPFAWFYQCCRYVRLTARAGGFAYFEKSRRESHRKHDFFHRLGLE